MTKIGVLRRTRYRNTGIETFEQNVVPELVERNDNIDAIPFSISNDYPLSVTIERIALGRSIKKHAKHYDKIFVPAQNLYTCHPDNADAELIPYVHDILPATTSFDNYYDSPINFGKKTVKNWLIQHYVEKLAASDQAICASHITELDLRHRTQFTGSTTVAPQGISTTEPDKDAPKYDLIYVGSLIPRKNPDFVRTTFQKAQEQGYDVASVNHAPLDLPGDHYTDISDRHLHSLLANARYYLHASKQEGFGRTPLEAQSHGTTVLALDTPINREVLGSEHFTWLTIDKPDHVLEILESGDHCDSEAAKENARSYDWESCINEIEEVLCQTT